MPLPALVLLALVQGITEFLPISSSGHLILVRVFGAEAGFDTLGPSASAELAFDVALHVGTLAAVVLYVWRDLWLVGKSLVGLPDDSQGEGARLAWQLVLATIPICIVGYFSKDLITDSLRTIEIVAWTTLVFGLLLWVADRTIDRLPLARLGYGKAVAIGIAQVLALVPGVSRSGICMTMGRALGLSRVDAARFALLLSIPTIAGAGVLATVDLVQAGNVQLEIDALIGAALAFASAWLAILLMMRWLARASFLPFVVYRVILGVVLLAVAYA